MSQLYPFTDPVTARSNPPRQIARGDGCRVIDTEANVFFDAVSALWCSSLGFNHPRLSAAAAQQMGQLGYYHSFMGRTCAVTETLAARLVDKLPGGLDHVLFGTGGSEAVDTAIKLMRYYQTARGKPGKRRVIAREAAYHGSGGISAALTAFDYCHDGFDLPGDAVLRTGRPHYWADAHPGESERDFSRRRAQELDRLIQKAGADTIGAFIGEPAIGSGGVILPPDGYWAEIQNVLARHDILLIADEIITGFGRTGEWFACDTYDISPDLMTMAKQLTASYFPLSAVAMTGAVHDTVAMQAHDLGTFGHGVTYGGHPVGAAIALETLAIYDEMDLPTHVARLGEALARGLVPIGEMNVVGDVRRVGLLAGVELLSDTPHGAALGQMVGAEAERRGVFFRIIGNVLAIAPPYIATLEDMEHVTTVMRDSIRHVADG